MRFDFCIGNPPYQDETVGEQKTYASPVYNLFLDEAYSVADSVEMIHPARFLFNAGSTPKQWNLQMLQDEHLQILWYERDSSKVFSNTEIKGGVVVSYRNANKVFGAIGTFTPYDKLNAILRKLIASPEMASMSEIVVSRTAYRLTDAMHRDFPDALGRLSNGHPYDMSTNIFDRLPNVFLNEKPTDGLSYIRILGREDGGRSGRILKYIRSDYVNSVSNLYKYKVVLASANGNGEFGETLASPIICEPGIGNTETFLSIGAFNTEREAQSCLKYIKSKFGRALLGVLKVTQHITPEKFRYVPLQDFTPASDIDWTQPIPAIDQQLYRKYGLTEEEIAFIESHVKEMT